MPPEEIPVNPKDIKGIDWNQLQLYQKKLNEKVKAALESRIAKDELLQKDDILAASRNYSSAGTGGQKLSPSRPLNSLGTAAEETHRMLKIYNQKIQDAIQTGQPIPKKTVENIKELMTRATELDEDVKNFPKAHTFKYMREGFLPSGRQAGTEYIEKQFWHPTKAEGRVSITGSGLRRRWKEVVPLIKKMTEKLSTAAPDFEKVFGRVADVVKKYTPPTGMAINPLSVDDVRRMHDLPQQHWNRLYGT